MKPVSSDETPTPQTDGLSEEAGSAKLAALLKIREIVSAGYGGCMPNGNIVDRREHPEAIPIQKNTMLDVPEPKKL